MSKDVNSLRVGACHFFFDNQDLGFSKDGAQLDIKTTTRRTDVDHFGPVEVIEVVLKREATIKLTLLETNLDVLYAATHTAYPNVVTVSGKRQLALPVRHGLDMHNKTGSLRLHPVDRDFTDTSEDIVFLRAVWTGNMSFVSKVDDVRSFSVEFAAYPNFGDNALFYYGT